MKIKHNPIDIPQNNPFANCKLAREPYAKILTEIVNTYADGFVLAINNEWGAGKTTFVKMWQQQLINDGFRTIYFNAWENDFDNNPLVALMSELETLTNVKNEKLFKSVVEKGAVLVKNIAPAVVKSLIKKYIADIDEIAVDAIENATKASTELLEEEIKEYASKKNTIIEFRNGLGRFVEQSDNPKPLIFIVDELDRCRPNYAVEVLEQIKHFFSVSGIIFVLSIDKNHLSSSIKGYYGSEQIDSNEYLRRFIDLEYSIPSPMMHLYNKYLYEYYSFSEFFANDGRRLHREYNYDGDNLLIIADILFSKHGTTLRQQEHIFAITKIILSSFRYDEYIFPHLLFVLVFLKTLRNNDYTRIYKSEFTIQELSDLFYSIIYSDNREYNNINLVYVESLLLWFYNNKRKNRSRVQLLNRDESGNMITGVVSKIENTQKNYKILDCLIDIQHKNFSDLSLDYITTKINLTDPIAIQ